MNRRKRVFNKIVNPLLIKHMLDPWASDSRCIAAGIPMKYLKYFKEVSANKNAKPIRYRYRGCLLYTSPSPRDVEESRMPSSA